MSDDGPVLVVGGTGALGGQVVDALVARGKEVRALVRPASDPGRLEAIGVDIARGDMMDRPSLVRAMDGADEVVTTAAGYTRHSKDDSPDIDVVGNRNLADAAAQAGAAGSCSPASSLRPDAPGPALLAQEARRGPARRAGRPVRGAATGRVPRPGDPVRR